MTKQEMMGSLKRDEVMRAQMLDAMVADFKRDVAGCTHIDSLVSIAANAARQIAEAQNKLHEVRAQIMVLEAIE